MTKGVETGTESLVWEKRLRPSVEVAIGAAEESSTIGEFLGWRSENDDGCRRPTVILLDLIDALYGVALGDGLRYAEQWLRLGSKDVYQFKALTDPQQRAARTEYRRRFLKMLGGCSRRSIPFPISILAGSSTTKWRAPSSPIFPRAPATCPR